MEINEFILEAKKLGIDVKEEHLALLKKYYYLLTEWNAKINLTAIVEEKDVYLKHFYDSLTLSKSIDLTKELTLCDIGTGAGFPGIVLKIFYPNLKITLVDSLLKRVKFLKLVISELSLNDIEAIHIRAEDFAKINREKYDIVTSRAVAQLPILCELCLPLVKVNGYFIAMKGNVSEEIASSVDILKKLSSKIVSVEHFLLPCERSQRNLVKIVKNSKTASIYPRNLNKLKKSN